MEGDIEKKMDLKVALEVTFWLFLKTKDSNEDTNSVINL